MTKALYTPPEADIARVLEQTGSDPRKLAVAYLRAQHRYKMAGQKERLVKSANEWIRAAEGVLGKRGRS